MKLAGGNGKYGQAFCVHWEHLLAVLGAGVTHFL